MDNEVTEVFAPQAGRRPPNFVVLKYFLLGMLISNGIESILIVPKTLSMMDDNEEQLQKIDNIEQDHEALKLELRHYDKLLEKLKAGDHEAVRELEHKISKVNTHHESPPKKTAHHTKVAEHHVPKGEKGDKESTKVEKKKKHVKTLEEEREEVYEVDTNKVVEILLLVYGILTLTMGLVAVFKENTKLLLAFIVTVALGLVVLFFSGLTLIVFMAILNDVIIALISFKYFQMLNDPCDTANYGLPTQYPDGSYNVDLTQPSNYK